jgi:hypothetical protein
MMGGLIQTKGTRRLANLFNSRFSVLTVTRGWRDGGGNTITAIFKSNNELLDISDAFIAQNANASAAANWPTDMNDLLYPSATLRIKTIVSNTQLTFQLPGGKPDAIVDTSAVCCIEPGKKAKAIKKNTKVSGAPGLSGNVLTVTLSKSATIADLAIGDRISFALGKHERLVRRWRWYLDKDLKPESNDAIRQAICAALDDDDFKRISFQTVEDTQKVIVTPQSILDTNDEFSDDMEMQILLMTQSTTSPDRLDPQ